MGAEVSPRLFSPVGGRCLFMSFPPLVVFQVEFWFVYLLLLDDRGTGCSFAWGSLVWCLGSRDYLRLFGGCG